MDLLVAIVLGCLIGVTLGALGAGGSILAVPVLVHLVGLPVHTATATSLVAVGAAAASASSTKGHRCRINWQIALWFVLAGTLGAIGGAALGRRLDGDILLVAFSGVMVVAAFRMFDKESSDGRASHNHGRASHNHSRASHNHSRASHNHRDSPRQVTFERAEPKSTLRRSVGFALAGTGVGFLTGLFGVGGGFVIVPVLTLVMGVTMSDAIATSLVVVAGNAIVALVVRGSEAVDWPVAAAFTVPMLVGSMIGAVAATRLDTVKTTRVFAILLVAVAAANAASVLLS